MKKQAKKIGAFVLAMVLVIALLPMTVPKAAAADNPEENDFEYTIRNGEATIIKYTGNAAIVDIPAVLGGCDVTVIGSYAFEDCESLTRVTMSNDIEVIKKGAFFNCSSLTEAVLSGRLSTIEADAFAQCASLITASIPASVTDIGEGAFRDCTMLAIINVAAGNMRYKAMNDVLFTLDESKLIQYPAGRPHPSYSIPQGTEEIDEFAFSGSEALKEVIIPNTVTSIGSHSFRNCLSLIGINIHAGVMEIGDLAFYGCSSMTYIRVAGGNMMYQSPGDVLYSGSVLVQYPANKAETGGRYSIQAGTTEIGPAAFNGCSKLVTIDTTGTLVRIGDNAFKGCTSLTDITIPEKVVKIGNNAFYHCTSLTKFTVTNNPYYHAENDVLYSKQDNKPVTLIQYPLGRTNSSFSLPDSVTVIQDNAFYNCTKLVSLFLVNGNNSLKEIGSSAFENCTGLTEITIPQGVTDINYNAFHGCTSLTAFRVDAPNETSDNFSTFEGVLFNADKDKLIQYPAGRNDTSYIIPFGVTRIEDKAFYQSKKLESLSFLEKGRSSLQWIGESAFEGCEKLEKADIPSEVTHIGKNAFHRCSELTGIDMKFDPSARYRSNDGILFNNDSTELIQYPAGKTDKSYPLPSTIKSIEENAFYGCRNLVSVSLPNGLTHIGTAAFWGCDKLTGIIIPQSTAYIGTDVFYGCSALTSITVEQNNRYYKSVDGVLFDNNEKVLIKYPAGKTGSRYKIETSVIIIRDRAFAGAGSLTGVMLGTESSAGRMQAGNVRWIGGDAFDKNSSLTLYDVMDSVTHTYAEKKGVSFSSNPSGFHTYTVKFDSRGGSAVSDIPNVPEGNTITKPAANPVRSEYEFVGWYKDEECTDEWIFDSDKVTGDIKLYAKWTKDVTVTITAIAGVGGEVSGYGIFSQNENVILTAVVNQGYRFIGWYEGEEKVSDDAIYVFTAAADRTLYARFTENTESNSSPEPSSSPPAVNERSLISIRLSRTALTLKKGNRAFLSVSYHPADTTDSKAVIWSTSNAKVITASNGLITAKNVGTAVITAKAAGKTAVCNVTVTESANGRKQLAKPKQLKLTAKKVTWKNVKNSNGYLLKIMQGKKVIKTVQIKKNRTNYKFTKALLRKFKKGKKYSISLVAKGNQMYKNSKAVKSKAKKMKK